MKPTRLFHVGQRPSQEHQCVAATYWHSTKTNGSIGRPKPTNHVFRAASHFHSISFAVVVLVLIGQSFVQVQGSCYEAQTSNYLCAGYENCGYTCLNGWCAYNGSRGCQCDCNICSQYWPSKFYDSSTSRCIDPPPSPTLAAPTTAAATTAAPTTAVKSCADDAIVKLNWPDSSAWINSGSTLPTYNSSDGSWVFDRAKSQYLDAGPRTLNPHLSGFTVTSRVLWSETGRHQRIIDFGSGGGTDSCNSILWALAPDSTRLHLSVIIPNSGSLRHVFFDSDISCVVE